MPFAEGTSSRGGGRKRGGGRPLRPSAVPSKQATIWAAEQNTPAWEVPPPPPSRKPARWTPGRPKPISPPKLSQNERYRLAIAAPVSLEARQALVATASPARQRELRNRRLPPPPPPGIPWYKKYAPISAIRATGRGVARAAEAYVEDPRRYSPTLRAALAGRAAGEIGGYLGAQGMRLGIGAAQEAQEAWATLTGSPWQQGQRRPTPSPGIAGALEAGVLEAGILPSETTTAIARGIPKVLAGGAGAGYAFRDPVKAGIKSGREALSILRGTGQAFALPVVLSDPSMSKQERFDLINEISQATVEDLNQRYGPDVTLAEAFQKGEEEPLISFLNAAAVVSAGTTSGVIALNALKGGAKFGEALSLARTPAQARTLRLRVPGGAETTTVEVPWSRSPLVRTTMQRPYDLTSRLVERLPGLRRLPIAERKRAARGLRRQMNRNLRRLPGEARSLFRDVEAVAKRDAPMQTALALLLQKPKGFSDEEWLQAIATDLRRQLETGRFVTPGERPSPGVQRLLNRARRYEQKAQDARSRRRAKAARNIAQEQGRLADALAGLSARRRQVSEERARLDSDETLSAEERARLLAENEIQQRVLDEQAEIAREELDDLSANEEPVEAPERTFLEQSLRQHQNFQGDNAQRVDDVLAVTDTRARVWARQTGNTPGEWYRDLETRVVSPHEIPREAAVLFQRRDWTPEELAVQRARYGDLDPERDLKTLLDDEEAVGFGVKGSGHPAQLRNREDLGGLMQDMARRLGEGIPYASDWYSNSGRAILEYAGGDFGKADEIAALFALYSPQKPVAENLALAFRVYEDYHRFGRAPAFGSVTQKRLAGEVLKGNRDWIRLVKPEQQPKVRRFYANIIKHIDPDLMRSRGFNGREVTADGWMGAAYGYMHNTGGSALSQAQIRFVERTTQALADHFGLEPEQAQAAVWTSIKAERDRTSAARYADPNTREQALSSAGESFSDSLFRPQYTLRLPLEGMSASKAAWQADLTPAERVAYTRELGHAYIEELRQEGFVSRLTDGGFGFYLNEAGEIEINPAVALEVAIGDTPATKWFGKLDDKGKPVWDPTPQRYYHVRPEQKRFYSGLAATLAEAAGQEAAVWGRRIVSRRQSDVTGWRIRVGRGVTEEETANLARVLDHSRFHATQHSDGISIALNSPDRVLGRATRIDRERRKGGDVKAAQREHETEYKRNDEHVREVIEATFADQTGTMDVGLDRYSHRGGYVAHQDYRQRIDESGRPDVLGRLGNRLSDRTEEVDARYQHDPARAASDAAERTAGRAAGVTRNQVRQGDLLGAIQFLDGDRGKRILFLTERSDASTVLHELIGHSAEEMRRFYPDEFGAVEREIGRPYADWTIDDQETFARWAERYFAEGLAPTPELALPMERIKSWMRATYAGMRRMLGGKLPVATRVLFDTYFGAYDDVNVARIAMNMSGRMDERLTMERFGGAEVITREELRALKRRVETQRYKRSLDGMVNRLEQLRDKGPNKWTDAEHEEYRELSAQVLVRQAEEEIKKNKREQNLREKLGDLEKAMSRGTDNRRFQGALESMRWISEDRERVLREVFGDAYDAVFANRTDLLADWLVEGGLLRADFERGSGFYFPATIETGLTTSLKQPARAIQGRVVGKTRLDLLKLHKRNNMILWQRGDWTADPAVLLEAHGRAQGYAWMNEVKKQLHKIGRPLTHEEASNLPRDVYILNLEGTPLGPSLKAQMRSNSTTSDVQNFYNGLDGGDNANLEASLANYARSFMIDPDNLPEGFDPLQIADLRVVPKEIVHRILRPVQGGSSFAGRRWDDFTTLARWALIYSNVPGYMVANGIGNLGFLLAHTGISMPQAIWAARKALLNPRLRDRIEAEIGELPYEVAVSRSRDFSEAARTVERRALRGIGIVDRLPRTIAWVHEARKAGYRSEDDMFRLLRGGDEKTRRDRERVSEYATQHMVDFDRLSDFERQTLTRALFVWPWIRGATAWPFWYGKNYPERAAVGANVGLTMEERRERMLGAVPSWYEGLFPVSVEGTRARVVQASPISPTSTAMQQLELIRDTVESVAGVKKADSQHLIGLFSPVLRDAVQVATGRNDFGKEQSLREVLGEIPTTIVPGYRLVEAIRDPETVPRVYTETGVTQRAARTFLRVAPLEISVPRLNAQAAVSGTMSASEKINNAVTQARKAWAKIQPGEPMNMKVERAARMRVLFSEYQRQAQDAKKEDREWDPKKLPSGGYEREPSLSEFEKAQIAYNILTTTYPQDPVIRRHSPADELNKRGYSPTSAHGRELLDVWMNVVWDSYTDWASFVKSAAKDKETAEQLRKERATGAK